MAPGTRTTTGTTDRTASFDALVADALDTWRRHQDILVLLLDGIPSAGFRAVPIGSRGRDVAMQFAHLHRVRRGWLLYHQTGKRPSVPRFDKEAPPAKRALRAMLRESGAEVEALLDQAMHGTARVRMFGRQPIRWLGYLIAHESHHRGQIMLALKQAGIRLPYQVAMNGLWGRWIDNK